MTQVSIGRSFEVLHVDDGLLDDTDLAISNGGGGMSSFTGSDGEFVGVGDHLFIFLDVLGELVQLPDDCGSLSFSNTNFKDRFGNHLSLAETILDRVGVGKKQQVEIEANVMHGIIMLPSKDKPKEIVIDQEEGQV